MKGIKIQETNLKFFAFRAGSGSEILNTVPGVELSGFVTIPEVVLELPELCVELELPTLPGILLGLLLLYLQLLLLLNNRGSGGKSLADNKSLGHVGMSVADIFDPLADNFYHLADKNVREKIPIWFNDMLWAKVFPQRNWVLLYIIMI